jgi:hypothetical protein
MALPTIAKTWTISANNRIPFVTVLDTASKYLFQLKEFLKTNGYTVKGSSNGTTASPANVLVADGVDRWVTAANVVTRATVTGAAQSWIVLTDGNSVDILLTYFGATDDIFRVSYSVGQLWTAQATATFQPTATDAVIATTAISMVGSSAILTDRLWFGWVDSTRKLCRFCVATVGNWTGAGWAVELFTPEVVAPASITPAVWGHCVALPGAPLLNGSVMGSARPIVASVPTPTTLSVVFSMEWTGASSTAQGLVKTELQGGASYPIYPLGIASNISGFYGKFGMLIDWWQGRVDAQAGSTYGNNQFIAIGSVNSSGGSSAGMWPWDGTTVPILT